MNKSTAKKILLTSHVLFSSFFVSNEAVSQTTITTAGPGTYTVPGTPPALYNLNIKVWGAGGSGGLGGQGIPSAGGGGGGYATVTLINVPAGTKFNYFVGAGGIATGTAPASGEASTVSDVNNTLLVRATGGLHGDTPTRAGGMPTTGTGYNGGDGAPVYNGQGGGGGGSAFTNANGNPGFQNTGGNGTGNGGNGGFNNIDATDGIPPGGGGGGRGGGQGNGNGNKVGFGRTGQIIFEAVCSPVDGGTASTTSNPLCIGDIAYFSLSGHTGTIQWQKRQAPSGTFATIIGATSPNLTDTQDVPGTWEYRAVVTNLCSGTANSNVVSLTVSPLSIGGTASGGNSEICFPAETGVITVSGYSGTIQWQRQINNGSWTSIANATSQNFSELISASTGFNPPQGGSFDTYNYRAVISNGACATVSEPIIGVKVFAPTIGGTVTGPNSQICFGSSTGTLTASGSGGTIQWKRQINNGAIVNVGTGLSTLIETISTANGFSQPAGNFDTYKFWTVVTNGACVSTSTIKSIKVDASNIGGNIQSANCGEAFYLPASTGIMTLTGYKGTIVKWQRQKNGLGYVDTTPLDTDNVHVENFTNEFNNSGNYRYIVLVENGVCPVTPSPFCEVDLFYQAPQPVELLNFRAFRKDQSIELNWSTASEANNEGFNIERSWDAINWQQLSFVPGQGTTTEFHTYTYTDFSPLSGTNYFRLSQRDYDRETEYFKLVAVDMTEELRPFQVYPNPATEQITVITSDESFNALRIYDLFGKLCLTMSVEGTEQVISLAGFAPGVYQVVFSQNGKLHTEKLFVE